MQEVRRFSDRITWTKWLILGDESVSSFLARVVGQLSNV